jgi:hypothetical protein
LKAREDALRPDKAKLTEFTEQLFVFIESASPCGIKDPEAQAAITKCLTAIEDAASGLREFAR